MVYRVLNRGVRPILLLGVDEDYAACERGVVEALPLMSTQYKPKGSWPRYAAAWGAARRLVKCDGPDESPNACDWNRGCDLAGVPRW